MKLNGIIRLLCVAALGSLASLSFAASVLEVTHSPSATQYGTVAAALAAAQPGDTIEIIDSSAPFVEAVDITKNTITLQGKAGLDPRPTIKADGSANPRDGAATFALSYTADGVVVKDLIIDGVGGNIAVDARWANGAQFSNCKMIGGGWNAWRGQVAATLTGCEIVGSGYTLEHFFGGPLTLTGCTVNGGSGVGVHVMGGTVNINGHSYISSGNSAGATILLETNFAGNPVVMNIADSIVSFDGTTNGNNLMVINGGSQATVAKTVTIDNSDFVGGLATTPSKTGAGIILNAATTLTVTDTIFFNITSVAYALNDNLTGVSEDFCVYKQAPNNLVDQGATVGAHDVFLTGAETDWLYADPAHGDFRLQKLSQAATLNSTGTPAYAGSQGLHPTMVPVELSTFSAE